MLTPDSAAKTAALKGALRSLRALAVFPLVSSRAQTEHAMCTEDTIKDSYPQAHQQGRARSRPGCQDSQQPKHMISMLVGNPDKSQ